MTAPHKLARRERVLVHVGKPCPYCGRDMSHIDSGLDTAVTRDHLHPRSQGGWLNQENVLIACQRCNNKRGDRSVEEWRAWLTEHPEWVALGSEPRVTHQGKAAAPATLGDIFRDPTKTKRAEDRIRSRAADAPLAITPTKGNDQ